MLDRVLAAILSLGICGAAYCGSPDPAATRSRPNRISKDAIEREISRWPPCVQRIFTQDYTLPQRGISFAYETGKGIWPQRSAAYIKEYKLILLGDSNDPQEAAHSIAHEIGHALVHEGLLEQNPSVKDSLRKATNSIFEEDSYRKTAEDQSRFFIIHQQMRLAHSELSHLSHCDILIQDAARDILSLSYGHFATRLLLKARARQESQAIQSSWQLLRIADRQIERCMDHHESDLPIHPILKDLEAIAESSNEATDWISENIQSTSAIMLTALREGTGAKPARNPYLHKSKAYNGACNQKDIALLREIISEVSKNLSVLQSRRTRVTTKIQEGISRLNTFDERFARVVDSLVSNYHGDGDLNNVRLDEAALTALEALSFNGEPIFREHAAMYRAGESLVREGADPYHIGESFHSNKGGLLIPGSRIIQTQRYPLFRISGDIPAVETLTARGHRGP